MPGATAPRSKGVPPCGPGCTRSRPTPAWRGCAGGRRRPRRSRRTADCPRRPHCLGCSPFPTPCSTCRHPSEEEPDAVVLARETIALAYLIAIQLLPPQQRAVLVLREVLRFSAKETAELLDITVAAANSALQRARGTLSGYRSSPEPNAPASPPTRDEQELLATYMRAHEDGDPGAIIAVLRTDARLSISRPGCPGTAATRSPRRSSRGWGRWARGAACRRARTVSRRWPTTCGPGARRSTAHSPWWFSGSGRDSSRRWRPSPSRHCSPPSGCLPRCRDRGGVSRSAG